MFSVQVHRFRDSVAIYLGNGETVYFPARDARRFASAIFKACRSIERERFVESTCGTYSATVRDWRGV